MQFNPNDWNVFHINKKSITLVHRHNRSMCWIGKWTFNNLRRNNYKIRYKNIPNPKNPGQVLTWIKLDKVD